MDSYPKSVAELIEEFEKLPSIGHKTAVRLAFHVLNSPMENAKQFSDAIINAKVSTKFCSVCGNMSESDICGICGNEKRDKSKICVVSEVKDLLAMDEAVGSRIYERSKDFQINIAPDIKKNYRLR